MQCLKNIERLSFNNNVLMKLLKLYEYKGKEYYYEETFKSTIKQILRQTIERDVFYLGMFLGLDISKNRQKLIIKNDSEPRTNDEKILSNLKSVLKLVIEGDRNTFDLTTNELLYLGKKVYNGTKDIRYRTVEIEVQNSLFIEKKRESMRKNTEELLEQYVRLLDSGRYEITQLVTNFYIDFINLAPFTDGNEIVGLIAIYVLLFKEKFQLFSYASYFELLYERKSDFENLTLKANFNWDKGFSETEPLNDLIIDILLKLYGKVDKLARDAKFDASIRKSYSIENTISKLPEIFTKEDVRAKHPTISMSTIDRTLKRLKEEGKIKPNGTGRSASWINIQTYDRFDKVPAQQMSLFDIMMEKDES